MAHSCNKERVEERRGTSYQTEDPPERRTYTRAAGGTRDNHNEGRERVDNSGAGFGAKKPGMEVGQNWICREQY